MFKKISHIIFALILMVTTMGVTVSQHFCGNSLKSVAIQAAPDHCCGIPCGCCHDESVTIKIEDDFFVTSYTSDFTQFAVLLPPVIGIDEIETIERQAFVFPERTIPPPKIQRILSDLQMYLL